MTTRERKLKQERKLERDKEKLTQRGTNRAISILQVIPMYVMHSTYGWGNVRLEKFIQELYRLTQKASDNPHLVELMAEELKQMKGFRFDLVNGDIENLWKADDSDTRRVIRGKKKGS